MDSYTLPAPASRPASSPNTAYLIASGDLRPTANLAGWPTQVRMEADLTAAFAELGWAVLRANPVDPATGHGFISSQRMGLEVFKNIPVDAPLIVAEAVWQYSHHVLAGLRTHQGPILTVANFAGDWPGLVGLLGLNAGMAKMGVEYSTIWSVDFTDDWFKAGIKSWVQNGTIAHDLSHVRDLPALLESPERALGRALARQLLADKAIIGVFDEGCMGMYNAIIDDELLNPIGIYKERLSQSALWAEMQTVPDQEADAVGAWLVAKGMTFRLGTDEATELTPAQLRWQYKMYIAALRISDDFGLDAVGIQYQQGLKDLSPASDLAEGILNNVDRPPVTSRDGARVLWDGQALPHFNEADEGVAVDALVTNRIWTAMGLDPATTLHDVRWGEEYDGQFVWVFEISGSVPPSHFAGGYAGAVGWRQDPVYFPLGGSTIKGVCKPGEIVWSRVFVQGGALHVDLGRASAISLPDEETERRSLATTPAWPIMHAVFHGVSRDQFMARHKANHLNVAYAPDAATADKALTAKAALFTELGVTVHLCGDTHLT
ncbi:L-fucose/L-arabinose isomerase family protein [Acrocarpospora macrocephala]|uniref:L-fucose isomerase n=1 Tax=Acrocarpospora macrocephala TaxID=150177 RepID=A0A5M3WFJ1_9ACTN|nr:fucose isomerase [Acrocarpospora macrocephala]GES07744.1 L-fucose isomerase [Acrocarpospora macrocephala]